MARRSSPNKGPRPVPTGDPGGLAKLLGIINNGGLNIEYMHAVLSRKSSSAYMVFRFDDVDAAVRALTSAGVKLVSANQIVDL